MLVLALMLVLELLLLVLYVIPVCVNYFDKKKKISCLMKTLFSFLIAQGSYSILSYLGEANLSHFF